MIALLAGALLAIGIAALLLAIALSWTAGAGMTGAAVVAGLGAMALGWIVILARSLHLETALQDAERVLHSRDEDLRVTRAALGDAELSLQAQSPDAAVAPLLGEVLRRVRDEADDEQVQPILDTYGGLTRRSADDLVGFEELIDEAERLAADLVPDDLPSERDVEEHGPVSLDRRRVVALLAQVLAAARDVAARHDASAIRIEIAEWQAGLLRARVVGSGPPPSPGSPRLAGLQVAAASARPLGGSVDWEYDADDAETEYVLLVPLSEADVRTDPTPPIRTRRP